jgi:hypothetical protein
MRPIDENKGDSLYLHSEAESQLLPDASFVFNFTCSAFTQQLRQVVYEGNRKGWSFDKYVAAHVEAHNNVEALRQYGYTRLTGFEKVDLFLRGIRVPEFNTCRNQLLTDPTIMSDFGRVKDHVIAFAHQKAAIAPPHATTHQVSAVSGAGQGRGGPGCGQDCGRGAGRGHGPHDPDARQLGLADQRNVDSCVVEHRNYSKAEYNQLTRMQRQKLWQLPINAMLIAVSLRTATTARLNTTN